MTGATPAAPGGSRRGVPSLHPVCLEVSLSAATQTTDPAFCEGLTTVVMSGASGSVLSFINVEDVAWRKRAGSSRAVDSSRRR